MRQLGVSKPFSFAYGGTGGSFGGLGGQGYGINPPGPTYGDSFNSHLYGGSGGGAGYFHPFETKPVIHTSLTMNIHRFCS